MSLLITLGWIALLVGLILIILGYTVAPRAQRPGVGALVLGLVLILIGYLVPAVASPGYTDTDEVEVGSG